jgi:hypothetical protein
MLDYLCHENLSESLIVQCWDHTLKIVFGFVCYSSLITPKAQLTYWRNTQQVIILAGYSGDHLNNGPVLKRST